MYARADDARHKVRVARGSRAAATVATVANAHLYDAFSGVEVVFRMQIRTQSSWNPSI
jgi:hypothetical protein